MDTADLERLKSDRKRRLFACARVRQVWHQLADERSRRAVEMAEAFADERATREQLAAARYAALEASSAAWTPATDDAWSTAWEDASAAASFGRTAAFTEEDLLLAEIVGPDVVPDLPRTQTVVDLAATIYRERRWPDMPILADALEEAGCTEAVVLLHLRGPGPHVLGCWVLDAVLGMV
jgi:hypothetical protein